jgi:Holliday junction DNA helicase RuvA
VRAIRGQDVARLTRIPGVGKKTAERIGLELKDRLPLGASGVGQPDATVAGDDLRSDLLSALTNLGSKGQVAEKAVDAAIKKAPDTTFEEALRDILRGMTRA